MRTISSLSVLIGLIIITSCSRELTYTFIVENDTNYDLLEVYFDWCHSDYVLSIKPQETSEPFTLDFKVPIFQVDGPGSLCPGVRVFSNSDSTYFNTCGVAIHRTEFSETSINKVIIKIDQEPYCETNRFKFVY